jgi:NAD(P)H-hydrate epimerase
MRVLDAAQMREADRQAINAIGIPSIVLMENAGRQVVAAIEASFDHLPDASVGILAGRGNNGGDGFVVARVLAPRVGSVRVVLAGRREEVEGDARLNLDLLGRLGVPVSEAPTESDWLHHSGALLACDLIVDALVGTGLREPLSGLYGRIVDDVNAAGRPVVAIDVPSGVSCDEAAPTGPTVRATLTVALAALKLPHVLLPADRCSGDLVLADIGIPETVIRDLAGPIVELVTRDAMAALVRPRPADSHKGDFGRILVVGGGPGKTGAAHLSAMAALRSGAGLVTIASHASTQPILAAMAPEYMTLALPESEGEGLAIEAASLVLEQRFDVLVVGPGLGTESGTGRVVLELMRRCPVPLVLDADALTICAALPGWSAGRAGPPLVVTPHPGEMARLAGTEIDAVQSRRLPMARQAAAEWKAHVILKGHRTIVASPGGRVAVNRTGNPGMASGGTGDVLSGMVGAWLAQLDDAEAASRLAVHLHGLAGDLAAAELGEMALTAGDLVRHLGAACLRLTTARGAGTIA